MDDSLHNEDLLVRYLDGNLSGDEKRDLEERLRTDVGLQQELASLQVAVEAIRQYGTRQKISSLHTGMMNELKTQPKAKVFSMKKTVRYAMAVAASILLLFVGAKLYMAAQQSPEKIYSDVFVDFNTATTRGGYDDISAIEKAYQQKNYKAVIQHTRSRQLDAKDSLLIGLAYLQSDRATQAISFFQQMVHSENEYRQDAEFYLSLSYLKNHEYAKSLQIMKAIASNSAHLYHEQLTVDAIKKVEALVE
jgi:hypothetical protein